MSRIDLINTETGEKRTFINVHYIDALIDSAMRDDGFVTARKNGTVRDWYANKIRILNGTKVVLKNWEMIK